MKYQKYITVMQMAMGVTASNKDDCIPPKRQLWVPPSSDAATSSGPVPPGAAVSQGKPSLRRIKGRVHRSKSLDSIDLLDCNGAKISRAGVLQFGHFTVYRLYKSLRQQSQKFLKCTPNRTQFSRSSTVSRTVS
ncbi:hypothetical protein AMELA_G00031100 [Ameiurus melas]|uniref:Uncharacterized protein n=1 Tax=Ameiurus melas TaxID=219545 RepID=A0A7J6B7B9_AMEME|nr:hypothetical protein AMELA_G00031100 [Ameiurus melas]